MIPARAIEPRLTSNTLILLVAVLLVACGNLSFFGNVLKTYQLDAGNALVLASLVVTLYAATVVLLALLCFGRTTKPVLAGILMLSAAAAYFMDSFGVVINDEMLQNALQTNVAEARDLLNLKLLAYLVLLGVLPAIGIAKLKLHWRGFRIEVIARAKLLVAVLLLLVGTVLAFGSFYASFLREHKLLRSYANPTYPLYSAIKYANSVFAVKGAQPLVAVGADAHIPASDIGRELIVLVVGETARADRFALNGYARDTTPLLRQAGAISFSNVYSCGTSTAVSVPCMFALDGSASKGGNQENLLDVMQRAGVSVQWLITILTLKVWRCACLIKASKHRRPIRFVIRNVAMKACW